MVDVLFEDFVPVERSLRDELVDSRILAIAVCLSDAVLFLLWPRRRAVAVEATCFLLTTTWPCVSGCSSTSIFVCGKDLRISRSGISSIIWQGLFWCSSC